MPHGSWSDGYESVDPAPMMIEIGDMVVANGRAGEVVGIDDITGTAIVRSFPQPGMEHLESGPRFTAEGEAQLLEKHWEWASASVRAAAADWQNWAARQEQAGRNHAEHIGEIDREWYREREVWEH